MINKNLIKLTKFIGLLSACQLMFCCYENMQDQFQIIAESGQNKAIFKYDGNIYNFEFNDSLWFLTEYGILSDDGNLFTNFKYNPNGTLQSLKYPNKGESVSQDFDNRVIKEQVTTSDNNTEIKNIIKQQDIKH
ncbi:hypothetical protein [Algoriphagus resistens]|uniref:hypothetical protein n=1 Tax=Algoriphagus resistens TaxID=1750590 RepID=UPI0007167F31|nr:hypothetical protein [Algoriphagus resistens]